MYYIGDYQRGNQNRKVNELCDKGHCTDLFYMYYLFIFYFKYVEKSTFGLHREINLH